MSDFKTALNNIQKQILEALKQASRPERMKEYAVFLADEIKLRTRLGYGVDKFEDNKKKLKPLAKSTIKQRQARRDKGKLSNQTDPRFSNLTQTGQLLDALDGRATSLGKAEVYLKDSRSGETLTNTELAKYQEEKKRIFMNVSKQEVKRLTDKIRKDLIASVRRG